MKLKLKKSSLIAIVFWLVGFILAFVISPDSQYIWLPDTLLLFGFLPLLVASKARWLWVVFGVCNLVIGFVLLVAYFLPDDFWQPYHLSEMNKHLRLYHPYFVWMIMGLLSAMVGAVYLIKDFAIWLIGKFKKHYSKSV